MFTHSHEAVVWSHIKHGRTELYEYLRSLDSHAWNTQSLCEGWRVKDVVAHLILEFRYTPTNSWKDFILSGLRFNTFLKNTAIKRGQAPQEVLIEQFSKTIDDQRKPDSVSAMNVLVDLLIHEQDIRIPLHQAKAMSTESLALVFSHWKPTDFNFGEKLTGVNDRAKGLKFVANDIGVTKGNGSIVEGTAEDIFMAVAGRKSSLEKLSGEGAKILRGRVNSP